VIITEETSIGVFEEYCSMHNINAFDRNSCEALTAVALAAKMGNISLLDSLVEKIGLEIINCYDRDYYTPLHIACHETRAPDAIYRIEQLYRGVKRLIELGADINFVSIDGWSPLSTSASRADNLPLTDLLLQHQAQTSPCTPHLKESKEGNVILCLPTIMKNIQKAEISRKITMLLWLAPRDESSALSIFPEEIVKNIATLFCEVIAMPNK
jgi:ankyrin repeat protein